MASTTSKYTPDVVKDWVTSYHAASGSLDMKAWLDMFSTDPAPAVKLFAFPDLVSREVIFPVFQDFVDQLDYLHHDMVLTQYVAPHIFHKCIVYYLPKGGDKDTDMIVSDVMVLFKVQETMDEKRGPWFKCERMEAYGDPSALLKKVRVG